MSEERDLELHQATVIFASRLREETSSGVLVASACFMAGALARRAGRPCKPPNLTDWAARRWREGWEREEAFQRLNAA